MYKPPPRVPAQSRFPGRGFITFQVFTLLFVSLLFIDEHRCKRASAQHERRAAENDWQVAAACLRVIGVCLRRRSRRSRRFYRRRRSSPRNRRRACRRCSRRCCRRRRGRSLRRARRRRSRGCCRRPRGRSRRRARRRRSRGCCRRRRSRSRCGLFHQRGHSIFNGLRHRVYLVLFRYVLVTHNCVNRRFHCGEVCIRVSIQRICLRNGLVHFRVVGIFVL